MAVCSFVMFTDSSSMWESNNKINPSVCIRCLCGQIDRSSLISRFSPCLGMKLDGSWYPLAYGSLTCEISY